MHCIFIELATTNSINFPGFSNYHSKRQKRNLPMALTFFLSTFCVTPSPTPSTHLVDRVSLFDKSNRMPCTHTHTHTVTRTIGRKYKKLCVIQFSVLFSFRGVFSFYVFSAYTKMSWSNAFNTSISCCTNQ